MAIEQTLTLIKPDAVYLGYADKIREVLLDAGFISTLDRTIQFSREDAKWFYRDHDGRIYFYGLYAAMSCDPCQVIILRRENAIAEALKIKPIIRERFPSAGGPFNSWHCSDGPQSYEHEYSVIRRCLKP